MATSDAPRHPTVTDAPLVPETMTEGVSGTPAGAEAEAATPGPRIPSALVEALHRIEGSRALDRPVDVVERLARAVVRPGATEDALTGAWLGHALHPLLTDIPLGTWLSASLLDLVGGRAARPAARRLIGIGILNALPTAASGLAEWLQTDRPTRRVGVVHAQANAVGLLLYGASYRARHKGRHLRGVALGMAGGAAAMAGGYLGGHLSLARKAGYRDPRFAAPAG
ncbi:MAG: DUF2231 domain-containing protein [Acidimicrobiales bacterium]